MSRLSPDQWQALSPYLDQALAMTDDARAAWLSSLGEQDPALAAQLGALLDEHRVLAQAGFLENGRFASMNPAAAPDSIPSALAPGMRFGSYVILQRLGAGGMGEVYRAKDTRLDREVAIKTLSLEGGSRPEALSRFEQEARSASALNHPNIVTIYELGHEDGTRYIAMELVEGETVRSMLATGPIAFRKSVAIAAQIADGLAKAHEIGLIHRDLKPENLMVSREGTAKVLDFGLAKLLKLDGANSSDESTTITEHGTIMGTVGYMSPEQSTGEEVDFRSDQFSFGSVLYEMASGTPAFKKKTHAETTAAILRDEPEHLAAKTLQAPAPFIWIVERCLAKDPKQRYASTRDLARDLAAVRDRIADAPVRESEPRPNNLPVQHTACIGREREAADLRQLLSRGDVHLVTLTGPGGIGKTRLALQVAGEIADQFPGGVCFVALSAVGERGVIASIAQAVGVRETGNRSPQENLTEQIGGLSQPLLLVLDNFEHLVSAAPVVAQMLTAGPKLKVMVTSQAPLHIYGEHEFPVPPLALPDPKSIPPLEALSRLPAIALFVERAQAVKRLFALTQENAPAVAAICARLDGLPLAIELAAARIKLLSPSAMLARLESRLNLLTGGARDLPTRQQTLRNTVEWSYGLLNGAEQILFRRLSVFAGGCTLEAVEAVCDTKGDLGLDVLDGIASLVDKSLAQQVEEADKERRFRMLSTIREYALERLAESNDEPATRRAHAAYYLVLAEEGAEDVAAQAEWLDRFEVEHENFRLAIDYLIKTGDAEWGLRFGAALFRFWETREYVVEGSDAIARLLAMEGSAARPKLRARLLFAGAVLATTQGDYASGRLLFEESLETCVKLNDNRGIAVALNALAVNARDIGDLAAACQLFEQCLGIWKDLGDPGDIARALSNLGSVMKLQGDYERAVVLYTECLTRFRQLGDGAGQAWTLNYLGDVAREKADLVAARSYCEQSLSEFRRLRDSWGIASTLSDLASLSCDQGNNTEALRLHGESIKLYKELGYKRGIARALECLSVSAAAQSNAEQSLHLAGAAAALRQQLGVPLGSAEQRRLEKALDFARRTLGNARGLTAWMEGWAMPIEQAVQEVLSCDAESEVRARNPA